MARYKYKCTKCGYEFTKIVDDLQYEQECPKCGNKATYNMPSSSCLTRYKGKGFYSTKDKEEK